MVSETQIVLLVFSIFVFNLQYIDVGRTSNPSIIIVGAGPAGIAAASLLLKNNITNIKILEAENRIGGRINSIAFGDAIIELGAEFCHGEKDNIVYDLVKSYGLLKGSENETTKWYLSNSEEINSTIVEKIENYLESFSEPEKLDACKKLQSIGACLDVSFKQLLDQTEDENERKILSHFTEWLHSYIAVFSSPLILQDMSIRHHYEKSEGDQDMNWDGKGYKIILDILMQKYPATADPLPIDDKILLNKEVVKISKWDQDDAVEVTCADGSTYTGDQVLFSPSLGVLKANHKTLFDPHLPEAKVDAIENLGFGAIIKIFLLFPAATNLSCNIMTVFDRDEFKTKNKHLSWLTDLNSIQPTAGNPRVIHGWYSGKHIPEIEDLSDEQVAEGQKYIVEKFLQPLLNVSSPEKIIRTKWWTNTHFRGTYSYESSRGSKSGKEYFDELAEPLRNRNNKPTLALIGEATTSKHYSTVHGAIDSGLREAQRIVDNYVTYNKQ